MNERRGAPVSTVHGAGIDEYRQGEPTYDMAAAMALLAYAGSPERPMPPSVSASEAELCFVWRRRCERCTAAPVDGPPTLQLSWDDTSPAAARRRRRVGGSDAYCARHHGGGGGGRPA